MGINEAEQEDEQSPAPNMKNVLYSIEEEKIDYSFPKQHTKEHTIEDFLDEMKIKQIFHSEINILKLIHCKNKSKPMAPRLLNISSNSLFLKRQSSEAMAFRKLT
jgi:hypothetical protein